MPLPFRPNCQPTSLGPLPHHTAASAWDAVLRYTPGLPALPLLNSEGESVTLISAEGFAGVEVHHLEPEVDRAVAEQSLDGLYAAYLRGSAPTQTTKLAAAPQVYPAEQSPYRRARMIFGALLGPVSLGLALVDQQGEPLINDSQLVDGLSKHVFLRRLWLQHILERTDKPVAVWLYEPYFDLLASPFIPLPVLDLVNATDQALGHELLRALWVPRLETISVLPNEMLLDVVGTPLPLPEHVALAAPLVRRLLEQKTALGWGIVPVTAEGLQRATAGRLAARFEVWLNALSHEGISPIDVVVASLIMPEDTLAYVEAAEAERALALTAELASLIRHSYGID